MKINKKITGGIGTGIAATTYALIMSFARVGPADIYPPANVPGALDQATVGNVSTTICNPNWSTSSIRPSVAYTNKLKYAQMAALGLKGKPIDYEEDHLCSLEIGGSPTSSLNLWPEPYDASIPDGSARSKDRLENYLHSQVCAGKITPAQACGMIAHDWYRLYQNEKAGLPIDATNTDDLVGQ